MTKIQFGTWVKDLRNECDYTQIKLANLLGFEHSQSIANIESGRTMLPKHCYKKFVDIFRLDAEQFLDAIVKVKRKELADIIYGRVSTEGK